ncbi:ankyrin repeat domain-containing protein [Candidatus Wolbachia massiliensis]|uniref:Ankyrin repeat domain-containing protein n=1 Tax=Candidatus Wolbachia massiliensis TaxID=1845000 RepID=A0A7L7YQS5_9RICK|nr:ankyrin repeat domain-containing protein [Candidatus Wolbachia massiliensis]QOD37987.1 ankyrin repeat domain-containing protein [Candidatus Wolbachia massiliensis]
MQELDRILIAVNCSQNLNKENIADKIKTKIEAKLNEENLVEWIKKDLEKLLKRWEKDNFDLKKFPYCNLLQLAAKFNCAKLAKHLVANGFDINNGFPLHCAAREKSQEVLVFLIQEKANVNLQDEDGETPLHCAAQHGHVQVVKILLAAKADVNMRDQWGSTPLHSASYRWDREIEMVKSLLKAGATNVQDKYGKTPLHYAAQRGYVQTVETLLKEGGADVNVQDKDGKTPLHHATDREGEHIQVVEILLQEGANVNLQDKEGKTSLHYAAKYGYMQVAEALLEGGAGVNLQDENGKTPLHYAAENEYTQIAEALLKKDAGVDVQDKEGRTPLYYAVYYTHDEHPRLNYQNPKVAKLLLNYGADPSFIHRPKAIIAGVTAGVISAIVVPLALAYATALPALAIVGITVASALIVGGISYGVAYKSSEHSLSSELSKVSCSNAHEQIPTP